MNESERIQELEGKLAQMQEELTHVLRKSREDLIATNKELYNSQLKTIEVYDHLLSIQVAGFQEIKQFLEEIKNKL